MVTSFRVEAGFMFLLGVARVEHLARRQAAHLDRPRRRRRRPAGPRSGRCAPCEARRRGARPPAAGARASSDRRRAGQPAPHAAPSSTRSPGHDRAHLLGQRRAASARPAPPWGPRDGWSGARCPAAGAGARAGTTRFTPASETGTTGTPASRASTKLPRLNGRTPASGLRVPSGKTATLVPSRMRCGRRAPGCAAPGRRCRGRCRCARPGRGTARARGRSRASACG